MNIFQWNFSTKFAWSVFSGVFCSQFLLICLVKYHHVWGGIRPVASTHWNMELQAFQDARSRFFRQATNFLIALTYHCTPKSPTNHQQIYFRFPGRNPLCRNTFGFPHKRLITLASTVYKLCSYLFMSERKKNHLQINKNKKRHVYRDVYYLSECSLNKKCSKLRGNYCNCKLLKHQHLIDVFSCSLLTCLSTGF